MSERVFAKAEAYLATLDHSKPSTVPYVLKINLTKGGSPYKTWIVDAKNRKISQGDAPADVTITEEEDTFLQVGSQKLSFEDAVKNGQIKVEGDPAIVQKLAAFLAKLDLS